MQDESMTAAAKWSDPRRRYTVLSSGELTRLLLAMREGVKCVNLPGDIEILYIELFHTHRRPVFPYDINVMIHLWSSEFEAVSLGQPVPKIDLVFESSGHGQ